MTDQQPKGNPMTKTTLLAAILLLLSPALASASLREHFAVGDIDASIPFAIVWQTESTAADDDPASNEGSYTTTGDAIFSITWGTNQRTCDDIEVYIDNTNLGSVDEVFITASDCSGDGSGDVTIQLWETKTFLDSDEQVLGLLASDWSNRKLLRLSSEPYGIDGLYTDSDGDGKYDRFDNCLLRDNFGQFDTDGDGWGNACDAAYGEDDTFVDGEDFTTFGTCYLEDRNPDCWEFDHTENGELIDAADYLAFGQLYLKPVGPGCQDNPALGCL